MQGNAGDGGLNNFNRETNRRDELQYGNADRWWLRSFIEPDVPHAVVIMLRPRYGTGQQPQVALESLQHHRQQFVIRPGQREEEAMIVHRQQGDYFFNRGIAFQSQPDGLRLLGLLLLAAGVLHDFALKPDLAGGLAEIVSRWVRQPLPVPGQSQQHFAIGLQFMAQRLDQMI